MKQQITIPKAESLEDTGRQPCDKTASLSRAPRRSRSLAAPASERNNSAVDFMLYHLTRTVIVVLQALPLSIVARLGRAGGALAYWLDARHRRVALQNLQRCFATEKTPAEIRALARENFRRIGENYASAANTAAMSAEEIKRVLEVAGAEKICPPASGPTPATRVVAIGHFGNFELFARLDIFAPGIKMATTYRGLRQPAFNRLLQSLRAHSGCQFFERRTDSDALKEAMNQPGLILGLLADQHAGRRAPRFPFSGTNARRALRRRSLPCAIIVHFTQGFVIAPAWGAGGLNSATKFHSVNTGNRVPRKQLRVT